MKKIEKYYLNKLISGIVLEKGVQCKKEVRIIEDCIKESTLDIWTTKNVFFPEINQYEVYKCFILKFEFCFGAFINSYVDLFHYTLKEIIYCDKVDEINANNIKIYFQNGLKLDDCTGSEFVKKVIYEDGSWYLKG